LIFKSNLMLIGPYIPQANGFASPVLSQYCRNLSMDKMTH